MCTEALGNTETRGNRLTRLVKINTPLVLSFCFGFTAVSRRRRERAGRAAADEKERKLLEEALVRGTSQYGYWP